MKDRIGADNSFLNSKQVDRDFEDDDEDDE